MKKLFFLLLSAPIFLQAQETTGIKWTTGLSWDQIKAKAKAENKYIFLDCFTTWCGPCKMMDQSVFANDSVGKYFEDKFIAVKVQMDKTKKDDDEIQKWYADAIEIAKKYEVEAYPTLLYFTPNGILTDKKVGANTDIGQFLNIAYEAMVVGKIYSDPSGIEKILLADYKSGKSIDNDSLRRVISYARRIKDPLYDQLLKEYVFYISSLDRKERYTEKNIRFLATLKFDSKSKMFDFFYKDDHFIDKVMGRKYYAAKVVDEIIQKEVAIPFLEKQNKHSDINMKGPYVGSNSPLPSYYEEADWNKLYEMIKQQFNKQVAARNVLTARMEWYNRNRNFEAMIKYALVRADKFKLYGFGYMEWAQINQFGWNTFLNVVNKDSLKKIIFPIGKLVKEGKPFWFVVDTYASLLYKVGKTEDAIKWEEQAMALAPGEQTVSHTLERMRKGEKWKGVVWE